MKTESKKKSADRKRRKETERKLDYIYCTYDGKQENNMELLMHQLFGARGFNTQKQPRWPTPVDSAKYELQHVDYVEYTTTSTDNVVHQTNSSGF